MFGSKDFHFTLVKTPMLGADLWAILKDLMQVLVHLEVGACRRKMHLLQWCAAADAYATADVNLLLLKQVQVHLLLLKLVQQQDFQENKC